MLRDYRLANPGAPPVLVGDLEPPVRRAVRLGLTAASATPRTRTASTSTCSTRARTARCCRRRRSPDVDRALAQDLVNRFVAAGAQFAFVGQHVGLGGPAGVVQAIAHHDDHVHVRIANALR